MVKSNFSCSIDDKDILELVLMKIYAYVFPYKVNMKIICFIRELFLYLYSSIMIKFEMVFLI